MTPTIAYDLIDTGFAYWWLISLYCLPFVVAGVVSMRYPAAVLSVLPLQLRAWKTGGVTRHVDLDAVRKMGRGFVAISLLIWSGLMLSYYDEYAELKHVYMEREYTVTTGPVQILSSPAQCSRVKNIRFGGAEKPVPHVDLERISVGGETFDYSSKYVRVGYSTTIACGDY